MGDEKSFSNLHELDKFSLLLFSHLKLSGVDVVDVLEVVHIIKDRLELFSVCFDFNCNL